MLWNTHPFTHTRLSVLCPGLPRWAGTRKVKPIWILPKHETVSGSGISWAICKSAPRSRQIPCQHPITQFFTGLMPFLPPYQQHQSKASAPCCGTMDKMRNVKICSTVCRRWYVNGEEGHSLLIWLAVRCTLDVRIKILVFSVGQLCYYLSKVTDKNSWTKNLIR